MNSCEVKGWSSCSPSCWEGDFDNSAVGLKDAKWPHKLQSALLNFKMGTSWYILCPSCFSMVVKCQLHIFSTIGIFHYRNGNSTMFIRSISLGAVVRMAPPPVSPGGRCFPASTSTPSATFPRFAEFEQRRGKERRNRAEVHSVIRVEFFPGIAAPSGVRNLRGYTYDSYIISPNPRFMLVVLW